MVEKIKQVFLDVLWTVLAGIVVGTAYYFFQNSNGFAPGGVGGLATITYHLTGDFIQLSGGFVGKSLSWTVLMLSFNLPIFILVSIFIDKKLGFILMLYMVVQTGVTIVYEALGWKPYCYENNKEDFQIVFACIATGVVSGVGFSMMLHRFGASGGTYAISALIKKVKPATNIAYVSFILDASVVAVAFFVYGFKITPMMCTLVNLFIANIVVDYVLSGGKNGYKFEIVTEEPDKLSAELMEKLGHGVTEIRAQGMYSNTDKYMLVCIIRKKQIGEMMKILKRYPGSFASFSKVNEVFGRFKK